MKDATMLDVDTATRCAVPSIRVIAASGLTPRTRCATCGLREVCLACDRVAEDVGHIEDLTVNHRPIKAGDSLYRTGDGFGSLYTVRSGFFKTVQSLEDGREQVTGFHMTGDLLGADGIGMGVHGCSAVALEDSRVCVFQYSRIEDLGRNAPQLQRRLHMAMSSEIVREHGVMRLLGVKSAEERLAVFLLDLSQRLAARGYSRSEFILRMTRNEIGSYLGVKLETVSRAFSKLRSEGLISVDRRYVRIRDVEGLHWNRQGATTLAGETRTRINSGRPSAAR
jgi:CRP/FNR family transcriptional regulator